MYNMPEIQNLENSGYLLPKKTSDKKTLVLDLDETLVHSQFQPFNTPSDIILKIELEDELHEIHVMVRPGVKEFLESMGKIYEVVIFTASVSKYADPLLDILDKDKNCQHRLFREHCTQINTCYVKEMKKLGRELKDIIIVDNSPMSYALNPENGLPISTWFEDKQDRELYNISSILEFLSFVPDVRNYINKFVINDEICYSNVINVFDRYNEMLNQKKISKNKLVKNKSKDDKKNMNINKNNSKQKYNTNNNINSNSLLSDNKENISNNINNNNCRFKKNETLANLKSKNDNTFDIKINLNINKKIRQNSKEINTNNKTKDNKFNPKSIIANIDNCENVNDNILNISNLNKLKNIITDTPNFIQTTKNKNTKINFNQNSNNIIASVNAVSNNNNINVIPNTTTHKRKNITLNYNNKNTNTNFLTKDNNKIIKYRKSDSANGLRLAKKTNQNNTTGTGTGTSTSVNKSTQFQHSNSIVLNKKKKVMNKSNYLNNNNNNFNLMNFTTKAQTTKNKNNKDFQLSMRISRDIEQELNKMEQSVECGHKINKKLSKSLTKEKISISLNSKNKYRYISKNNYNNNTFSNKSSLIKNSKLKEKTNYIYHKKNKSINTTSIIPFPSTIKNTDNNNNTTKSTEKKYSKYSNNTNKSKNKSNNNNLFKYKKNSFNGSINHKRFLSTSDSYTSNFLNHIYSSNTSKANHSSIIGSGPGNINITTNANNSNNSNGNNLTYNNKLKDYQRKINGNKKIDINLLKTERIKEYLNHNKNYNSNNINMKGKKLEKKIPFNLTKKKNSINENNHYKKKIPVNTNGNKNIVNINLNENKKLGIHIKNVSYHPEISSIFSVRPKSTKQMSNTKNNINYKVEVSCSNNIRNLRNHKGNSNDKINISKKDISVSKSSRTNN